MPAADGSLPVGSLRPLTNRPERLVVRVGRQRVGLVTRESAAGMGLVEGAAWTEDRARAVAEATEALLARDAAERALSRRALSRRELENRLARRGFGPAAAGAAADAMQRLGLLNEAALAEAVVRGMLARKPAGRRLLSSKLARRGVARPQADEAISRELAGRDLAADALALARQRASRLPAGIEPETAARRLMGLLARRGFEAGVCMTAVRRALKERGRGADGETRSGYA